MNVRDLEMAVWKIEEVLIRVRAPVNRAVGEYDFDRQTSRNMSVTSWITGRLQPRLDGLDVSVIDGTYRQPHGRTKMGNLRASYKR